MIHNWAQYSAKKPSSPPLNPAYPPPHCKIHHVHQLLIAINLTSLPPRYLQRCLPAGICFLHVILCSRYSGKSDLSFCDSRKGNSMHCNVKTSQHSKQGDSRDVDESLGVNTQSPPTHLLVAQALRESYLLYAEWLCLDYAFRLSGLYHFHCCW